MKTGFIYAIRNCLDGRVYVGSTRYENHRWSEHIYQLRNQRHGNSHLQRAWNKHGEENFRFMIIETGIPECDLLKREKDYIEFFDACNAEFGYNFTEDPRQPKSPGAKNVVQIDPMIAEVVATYASGVEAADALCCENLRTASSNIGRSCGDMSRPRIAYGFVWCRESDVEFRLNQVRESSYQSPKVLQYDLVGRFVREWSCASVAGKALGLLPSCIRNACKGHSYQSGGFQWRRYTKDYPKRIEFYLGKNFSPVVQFDASGVRLSEYNGVKEAADVVGVDHASIGNCCRGSRQAKTAGGFQWRYLRDVPSGDVDPIVYENGWAGGGA